MLNLNGITSTPAANGTAVLTRKCPFCGKDNTVIVKLDEYAAGLKAAARGALIQDAFPTWTPDEREMLISGICKDCWDAL